MKERPILFSAPMVRALLDGSKTQTRRKYKVNNGGLWPNINDIPGMRQILRNCPYGQHGDRLWVREAFYEEFGRVPAGEEERLEWVESGYLAYRASDEQPYGSGGYLPWKPSIFMPRWASRINLEIVSVRVERLQDISETDALAEGIDQDTCDPVRAYRDLWEAINGDGSWDTNPWVWAITFEIGKNEHKTTCA